MKKNHFKRNETGYHNAAVKILAAWVGGVIEQPFYLDGSISFIPDITVSKDNILTSIYEVVYSHPIDGKKLGYIQEWCFRNQTELSVFEVSADYILSLTEKPDRIVTMDYYSVDPFENNYNPGDHEDLYER